ncbi:MAG: phytanoyl-CoA dioxygenase family protein [Acidimicrobiia bacterium]|nr:phytanoyl-CoA dioxygenase family protein [Acidimicrobiia bacterium]
MSVDTAECLAAADHLLAEGRVTAAIDLLTEAARPAENYELERRLIEIRHTGCTRTPEADAPAHWPPLHPDLFPDCGGVPEIDRAELTAEAMGSALVHHGSLLVRGVFPAHTAAQLKDDTDRALAAAAERRAVKGKKPTHSYFQPYDPPGSDLAVARAWQVDSGSVSVADAPRVAVHLMDAFEASGIVPIIADYFGEIPVLTGRKTIVRKVPADSKFEWHQDGQFLGDDLRVVNAWIPVTRCGSTAPGLAMIPRRLDRILSTGGDGQAFDWTVTPDNVEAFTGGAPVVYPEFEAGDALFFDDWLLHATGTRPGMTEDRYGVEAWFFASSHAVERWIPIQV